MAVEIRYDLVAGENLSSLLVQLNDKLTALAQLRATKKTADLDCQPGAWTGGARTTFDDQYATEQRALGDLTDRALSIKGRVDQANQQYQQLQKGHDGNIKLS